MEAILHILQILELLNIPSYQLLLTFCTKVS